MPKRGGPRNLVRTIPGPSENGALGWAGAQTWLLYSALSGESHPLGTLAPTQSWPRCFRDLAGRPWSGPHNKYSAIDA